jgi:hypothetical protein
MAWIQIILAYRVKGQQASFHPEMVLFLISERETVLCLKSISGWAQANQAPRSKLRGIRAEFAEANPPSL